MAVARGFESIFAAALTRTLVATSAGYHPQLLLRAFVRLLKRKKARSSWWGHERAGEGVKDLCPEIHGD